MHPRATPAIVRPTPARLLLGWREWLALPALGVTCIRAKIDTGARSSSLHVQDQELFERDGRSWVRFVLFHGLREHLSHVVETEVLDQREVTDSGGHRETRVFVRSILQFANVAPWPIEINLTQRRNMLFPMLLGRTALRRRCLVEPARSYLLGTPAEIED